MNLEPRSRSAAARVATVVAAGRLAVAATHEDGILPSLAALTSSDSTSSATLTSGNIALTLTNGVSSGKWTGAFTILPGGASQYFRITVTNGGSARLAYSVTATSATNTLASRMTVSIASLATASTTCSSANYALGTVVSHSGAVAFGSTTTTKVIGDPTTGIQTGDRTLTAAAEDNLCLRVDFPAGTGLGYAGRGTTATTTFTFSAESA